ncbi:13374_t:CDS:2, partial [Cetraspora pellucida]
MTTLQLKLEDHKAQDLLKKLMRFVFDRKRKEWKPRQRGNTIGCMYFIHPQAEERYYLHLLLNIVRGAISFSHLRTVNNIEYPTFKDACEALGMLQNDNEWDECLNEAQQIKPRFQMRYLFAVILMFCNSTYPELLWNKYITAFSDDILFQCRTEAENDTNYTFTENDVYNIALNQLESILLKNGTTLAHFPSMLIPTSLSEPLLHQNHLLTTEFHTSNDIDRHGFADWLLQIGEDRAKRFPDKNDFIKIPDDILLSSQNIHALINLVYPNLTSQANNSSYLMDRGILASKNTDVSTINSTIFALYPGHKIEYLSAD